MMMRGKTQYEQTVRATMIIGAAFMLLGLVLGTRGRRLPSRTQRMEASLARGYPSLAPYDALAPLAGGPPTSSDGFREIPIHPTREYDNLSREDILAQRTARIGENADVLASLGAKAYAPSAEVFGRVEGGLPWLGLVGSSYFEGGPRAAEGDSRESIFVENPYVLVGVSTWYMDVGSDFEGRTPPHAIVPMPVSLHVSPDGRRGWARFQVSSVLRDELAVGGDPDKTLLVSVVTYNASDLGLPYVGLDAEASSGLRVPMLALVRDDENLHSAHDCAGGPRCNRLGGGNDLEVKVGHFPARLVVRLWRTRPSGMEDPPHVWFVVELV
jgi:hypothetical protein